MEKKPTTVAELVKFLQTLDQDKLIERGDYTWCSVEFELKIDEALHDPNVLVLW